MRQELVRIMMEMVRDQEAAAAALIIFFRLGFYCILTENELLLIFRGYGPPLAI